MTVVLLRLLQLHRNYVSSNFFIIMSLTQCSEIYFTMFCVHITHKLPYPFVFHSFHLLLTTHYLISIVVANTILS
jgi:hypothetical protein